MGVTVNIDSIDEMIEIEKLANNYKGKIFNIGIRCNYDVGDGVVDDLTLPDPRLEPRTTIAGIPEPQDGAIVERDRSLGRVDGDNDLADDFITKVLVGHVIVGVIAFSWIQHGA